ncbi:hypothetical protein ACB092_03G055600 [Castanea dentata]
MIVRDVVSWGSIISGYIVYVAWWCAMVLLELGSARYSKSEQQGRNIFSSPSLMLRTSLLVTSTVCYTKRISTRLD